MERGDGCRSVYTVSDKHLRHGGSGYETNAGGVLLFVDPREANKRL